MFSQRTAVFLAFLTAAAATPAANAEQTLTPVYGGWISPRQPVTVSATVTLQSSCEHSAAWVGVNGPFGIRGDWLQAGVATIDGHPTLYVERSHRGVVSLRKLGSGAGPHRVEVVGRGSRWVARVDGVTVRTLPASDRLTSASVLGEAYPDCQDFRASFSGRGQTGAVRWESGMAVTGETVSR